MGVAADDPVTASGLHVAVPTTMVQVGKLTRYQLREYLRSLRFVALAGIVLIIGVILTTVVGYYRGLVISTNLAFYGSFWGSGVSLVIVLAAVFFGGDAIAGEFQNKTGYFLMGLPIRRATVYVGKFIAAYLASVAMLAVYMLILVANGAYYFGGGALPWQLGLSFVLALVYLGAVMGATFLFSSLFKTSAYGFVLTAILFLFGFTLLQELVTGLAKIEPWMVISYASSTIANVFTPGFSWGVYGTAAQVPSPFDPRRVTTVWTPGIGEGILIMIVYLVVTAAVGLWLFEQEEFT
jgi:ABC-2 type transport system permease protein